jgi:GMP synthase (glutamine-hydrolysing)
VTYGEGITRAGRVSRHAFDGMTADFFPFDMSFLGRVSTRIINEGNGINWGTDDITSKPPGTIEWE